MIGRVALAALLLLIALPARAEDEYSQHVPGQSRPIEEASRPIEGEIDDPGLGLPNLSDWPTRLNTTPPIGNTHLWRASGRMDRPRFEWVLAEPSPGQPFRIAIDAKPAYSTFNLNTLGSNNAFGNKVKLGAVGEIAPRVRLGMFATFEAEIEQFSGAWRPSSQAGVAGFMNYEVRPGLYLGAEARFWRSYAGLYGTRELGHDLFAGPTLEWKIDRNTLVFVSYAPRINNSKGGKSQFERQSRLGADVFDNHPLRVKVEYRW